MGDKSMSYYGVTIVVDEDTIEKMKSYYSKHMVANNEDYTTFHAKLEDVIIKAYSNKKNRKFKINFSGDNALNEARIWDVNAKLIEPKKVIPIEWENIDDQIGSDETGVGDFFAPTVVVACYCSKEQIQVLKELGIKDSKKMTDIKIREIAPKIMNIVKYEKLIMSNQKLSSMIREQKAQKLALEAIMHNECHLRLIKKHNLNNKNVYVDEFLTEYNYRECLASKVIPAKLHFKQKGESYYPSVAAASIIARYILLIYMDALNREYNEKFPLGAGSKVDTFAENFVKNHSLEELNKLVKRQFINYQDLLERLANNL